MLLKAFKLGRQKLWTYHREYLRSKHELNYLFWECTLNCNFKCKHCGSRAGENVFKQTVTTQDIKDTFSDVANNFQPEKITIAVTGGEPLLRPDVFEVMGYAHNLGFRWGMVTNGYLIDEKIVGKAKQSGMGTVDISVDGIKDTHDNFRNMPGSYKRVKKAVKLFAEADFLNPLRITTTVHPQNINQLEEMYCVFTSWGIDSWRILTIDPIGRAEKNNDILLNKQQIKEILQFVKEKRKQRNGIEITLGCAHFLGDEFEDEVRNNFFYCATGINVGSILHNGDIFVCPNVPRREEFIQGNIKEDSFSEVWENRFEIFRDKNRTNCQECSQCQYWDECLGGSFHTWDNEKKKQKVCLIRKNLYK